MQEIAEEERVTLTDWSRIIFRRWKVILIIFTAAFSITFFLRFYNSYREMKQQKPLYTAHIKIMVGPETLEAVTKEGQILKRIYSYSSERSMLEGEAVTQQAAAVLKEKFGYKKSKGKLAIEVRRSITVTSADTDEDSRKNIVVISATSDNPHRAFDIVNALVEGYQRQKKEDQAKFYTDTSRAFTEQLNAAREDLHKAKDNLTDFIMENEEIAEVIKSYGVSGEKDERGPSDDFGITEKYLKLKSEISERKEFLDSVKEKALKDKLAAPALIAKRYNHLIDLNLKNMLLEKEEELNDLLLIKEEAHPELIRARQEIRAIKNKIDKEIENAIENMELDLDILKFQERKLFRLIEADVHKKIIAYNMLKRDIEVKHNIYLNLAERMDQLNIVEKLRRYSEIRVLESAKVPINASNPIKIDPAQAILFSLSIAAFSCLASVYALETFDTSIRDVEQLEELIGSRAVGAIPRHRKRKPRKSHKRE